MVKLPLERAEKVLDLEDRVLRSAGQVLLELLALQPELEELDQELAVLLVSALVERVQDLEDPDLLRAEPPLAEMALLELDKAVLETVLEEQLNWELRELAMASEAMESAVVEQAHSRAELEMESADLERELEAMQLTDLEVKEPESVVTATALEATDHKAPQLAMVSVVQVQVSEDLLFTESLARELVLEASERALERHLSTLSA